MSIFGQTDKIMLKIMIGDAESGFYSAALTCAGMTVFVFTAIIDSFRPVIFENKKSSQAVYKTNTVRLYSLIFFMALAQSVVLTLLAEPIIWILYGAEYGPATPILRVITWYSAFSYLGHARYIWFLAEGKQKYIGMINLIGAIVNVAGNAILIPVWGACGAAVASVTTQVVTNFVLNFFIPPIRENGMWMLEAFHPRVLLDMIGIKKK